MAASIGWCEPEIGWYTVETVDDAVPAGPWLMMHTEQMRVPPGGVELARSPAGPAGFSHGPHLGVQFHPEVDVERVAVWARADPGLAKVGLTPDELVAQSEEHAPAAREQAFALFDRWLAGALNGGGPAVPDW